MRSLRASTSVTPCAPPRSPARGAAAGRPSPGSPSPSPTARPPHVCRLRRQRGEPFAGHEFVTGVSQVQELIFYIELCDYRQTSMDATPFTFPNLRSMELSTDFDDMHNISLMFFLLRISPNLEKLKIELRQPRTVANRKFLNAQWTAGMCANLQVVEITSAKGWLPLSFLKLILCKASLLRTLSLDKCPVSKDNPLSELLNCRRASPQAQVQFKDQLEKINFDRMKFAEKKTQLRNRLNFVCCFERIFQNR